ncbi:MAG TPA: hypothetical protein VED59_08310, partial [Acidimicrobiales bacterium]|nr:hypothetical protein [Acidimicrobiales bacterium]
MSILRVGVISLGFGPRRGVSTMPRLTHRPPRYCQHKATNRAMVYVGGKAVYLGRYNSPESKAEYKRIVGEWSNPSKPVIEPAPVVASCVLTIAEALVQYKGHA